MIDIKSLGKDVAVEACGDKYKALNLLAVQLRDKNYAPDFGIDIDFFVNSDHELTRTSLLSHILKRLADYSISVTDATSVASDFIAELKINIKDK